MDHSADTNADIWKSDRIIEDWMSEADERERSRSTHRRFMAELLPFGEQDAFTFLDLGAGTGAASKAILGLFPRASAILADFSPQMMEGGTRELQGFTGRFRYVEFDLVAGGWPDAIPGALDAIVTSLAVHHLPDVRKQALFGEILDRLAPGGWFLNYDPVSSPDAAVEAAWQRANDRQDPQAAVKRLNRTPHEQARWENHIRYIIPLEQQLGYLRSAGFHGIDVYWKHLENVIYGGYRPS